MVQGTQQSEELDTEFAAEIEIPKSANEDYSFSWRRLWAFTGPGFLISIAFLDPGNIQADLLGGALAQYQLLWVVLYSMVLGLFIQMLSARLGVVTGQHLAEICYYRYPKVPRLLVWITTEIAIIGSDMQEVIGTAVAIYMLSNRWVPLWAGVLLTILDTITFLFLDKYGLRKLEAFFGLLIVVMAVTFGYEFFVVAPDAGGIAKGLAVPMCEDCNKEALTQAVGIVGAVIAPYNLYLHSALVKSRKVDNTKRLETKDANRYVLIEATIALVVSFIINIFVVAVFAKGVYGKKNEDIFNRCNETDYKAFIDLSALKNDNETFEADLYTSGLYIGCEFGPIPYYIWAIGILASGQSSTMTGTYAGQFAMEGFLHITWPRWKRVLVTRTIAIAPTLLVSLVSGLDQLTGLNDYLNALMVLQLPFAVLPTLTFSTSKRVMGKFANNLFNTITATLLLLLVILINIYFVIQTLLGIDYNAAVIWSCAGVFTFFYTIFVLYLIGCYLSVLGFKFHERIPWIGKYCIEVEQKSYRYRD